MPRALFVEVFGDVYEHTPQIAEAAHRAGLGPGCDNATGLHAIMAQAMGALPDAAKLALIRAHPDLAGRLAKSATLTAASAKEQASAGLDHLTPDERARFTTLNQAYVTRFGFPFIMAITGRSKAEILAAFDARLAHDAAHEFGQALKEIDRIALLRLKERLTG